MGRGFLQEKKQNITPRHLRHDVFTAGSVRLRLIQLINIIIAVVQMQMPSFECCLNQKMDFNRSMLRLET